jgi:hypothetical protein
MALASSHQATSQVSVTQNSVNFSSAQASLLHLRALINQLQAFSLSIDLKMVS